MHWLGRAILAILAASTLGFLVGFAIYRLAEANGWVWTGAYSAGSPGAIMAVSAALFALLSFRILTGRYARSLEHATCCRRCGCILRGISEPRCPECGERI